MKPTASKVTPLLYRDRGAYIRREARRGKVKIRARENKEPCPNCEGKYDEVYQHVKEHREEANLYDDDDRWFCLCGHTEVPSKDSTLEVWRDWRKAINSTPDTLTGKLHR